MNGSMVKEVMAVTCSCQRTQRGSESRRERILKTFTFIHFHSSIHHERQAQAPGSKQSDLYMCTYALKTQQQTQRIGVHAHTLSCSFPYLPALYSEDMERRLTPLLFGPE